MIFTVSKFIGREDCYMYDTLSKLMHAVHCCPLFCRMCVVGETKQVLTSDSLDAYVITSSTSYVCWLNCIQPTTRLSDAMVLL